MDLFPEEQPFVLLNDGCRIPCLGFGLGGVPNDRAEETASQAIDAGFTLFDTAAIYGNEDGLGRAVRRAREAGRNVLVQTKLWVADYGYDSALRGFDAALTRLGVETIDLFIVHWPAPALNRYVETWSALIRLRDEGRVNSIGVSNFTVDQLERLQRETGVLPAVNQVEMHPRFQQYALRHFHRCAGIVTQAYSPLGQGSMLNEPNLVEIARKHGRTPAQVILRWHLELGTIPIARADTPAQMTENTKLFSFRLDPVDLETITRLHRWTGRIYGHPETYNGETTLPARLKSALLHPSKVVRRVLQRTGF